MKKLYGSVCLLLCAALAGAQAPQTSNVTGRVIAGGPPALYGYVVQLERQGPREGPPPEGDVSIDGDFTVRNVPYGQYLLKVTAYGGDLISQQFVTVHEQDTIFEVRLPARPALPTGGTVSLRQLANPPAKKAVSAAAAAQRFAEKGRIADAAGELRKAIRISPDYAVAHSNLGVDYIRLGRFDEGRAEIQRAIGIAGPNAHDYANLAFAFAGLQQLDEALASARKALAIDGRCAAAHYLIGTVLAATPATRAEGIAHLREAAATIPSAQTALQKWTR